MYLGVDGISFNSQHIYTYSVKKRNERTCLFPIYKLNIIQFLTYVEVDMECY